MARVYMSYRMLLTPQYHINNPRAAQGCRASKVKCDTKRPCSHCLRLQHTCRPARKRPRPGSASLAGLDHTHGANGEGGGGKKAGGRKGRGNANKQHPTEAGGLMPGQRFCRLAREQLVPRELAEAMVQAVGRLAREGRVDRGKARSTL